MQNEEGLYRWRQEEDSLQDRSGNFNIFSKINEVIPLTYNERLNGTEIYLIFDSKLDKTC